jgi:hypothetical protein
MPSLVLQVIRIADMAMTYRETEAETNKKFAGVLVNKGRGLDMLLHTNASFWAGDDPPKSSWIPETVRQWSMTTLTSFYNSDLNSSSSNEAQSHVSFLDQKASILKIVGSPLDTFHQCSQCHYEIYQPSENEANIAQFLNELDEFLSGERYFTGESWVEVRSRTMFVHGLVQPASTSAELITRYQEMRTAFSEFQTNPFPWRSRLQDFTKKTCFQTMDNIMQGNKLCKTTKGYIGIVPNNTHETDEIFLPRGSTFPFVLRPNQEQLGYFFLVGTCYIHGLMDNRLWTMDRPESSIYII